MTEPSGIYSAWKVCIVSLSHRQDLLIGPRQANAIGRSSKTVREFLEKNHKDDMTRDESIKLTIKSLLEVVQTGAKNIEISVLDGYNKITVGVHFEVHDRAPFHGVFRAWNSLRLRVSSRTSNGRKKLVRIDLCRAHRSQ